MPPLRRVRSLLLLALALPLSAALTLECQPIHDVSEYARVEIAAGPDFEARLREALLMAKPGTVFALPAGTFDIEGTFTVEASHVVIQGTGMDRTILDFSDQQFGTQGFYATGDHFLIQDLTILDPIGDGVKTQGIEGATFRRIRVEWTRGPSVLNGAYGLYPAENEDVLVEGCIVKGSRDAGIYVGQSDNVVVRGNYVEDNVLGIEIENSINSDVYYNTAVGNTAGIAVFNLPDLKDGCCTRVFHNTVIGNNEPNFAAGGIIKLVPGGTGIVAIAAKDLEIFGNHIEGNDTVNLVAAGFQIALEPIQDPDYDPYAERVHIHDNSFGPGGTDPQGELGQAIPAILGAPAPDILFGGWVDRDKIPGFDNTSFPWVAQATEAIRNCAHDNGDASVGHLNALGAPQGFSLFDPAPFACERPPRLDVLMPPAPPAPDVDAGFPPEEIERLCNAPGDGVNWDAFVVNCPRLEQYRLFEGVDPRVDPQEGGFPYDLTTPLFSDYARKDRFVFLPPGTGMQYSEDGVFDFPVGTIIAKTFSFQDLSGIVAVDRVVETRLLIRRPEGWEGLPYIWDEAFSEATLEVAGGVARDVRATDPDGVTHEFDYAVPDMAQCGSCHFGSGGDVPIGPKARLLNRDLDHGDGDVENQLTRWARLGLLAGAPGSPETQAPRLPFWDDPADGTLAERARAYLESNCAHCHNPEGRAGFTSLWLGHDAPLDQNYGICKRPIAAGAGALNLLWDVDPGHPERSILVGRMDSAQPAIMMPELSKSIVHGPGVDLVSAWIATLPGSCEE